MKKILIFILLTAVCLFCSLDAWAAMDWEGTMPFNQYRIQSVAYPTAYLNTMTQAQKDAWSQSVENWVCTTESPTNYFLLKNAEGPQVFPFMENGKLKYIRIYRSGGDRVATDDSEWKSNSDYLNKNNGTYTIAERYMDWGYKPLYIRAQSANNVVATSANPGSVTNEMRWRSVLAIASPQRFYLYNAAQGVFIKKNSDGKTGVTTDPEEATLIELSDTMFGQAMSFKFSGSSNYISHSKGSNQSSTSALTFTIEPVNGGFYIHNKNGDSNERYMQATNSTSNVSFSKSDDCVDVNRTWKFISEDEYNQKVAASLLPDHKCFDKIITCCTDMVTPTSRTGTQAVPTTVTQKNADYYVKAHGDYLRFSTAGEVFYSAHLPAAKYTITMWEACAGSTYMNLYSTAGTDDTHKVTYNGKTYKRLFNGHMDFTGDASSAHNVPFFSKTKVINIESEADFIIGVEGSAEAAFDQILIEADGPAFCNNCYQYLICYDLDATSGKVVSEWNVQSELCDAGTELTVPAPPTAPNGYTFGCWNTRADLRGMSFHVGDQVTLPTIYTDNYNIMSLYAHWLPKTITVTLDKNTAGTTNGSATVLFENTVSTTFTGVTYPSNLHLKGYYTHAEGGRKVMNADGSLTTQVTGWVDRSGRWMKGSDCTLYAQYGSMCTVTYESGSEGQLRVLDDMGNVIPSGTQVVEGTVVTLQARVNQPGHQVYQWNVNGNITETDCGLWPVTITTDTHISVAYETRSQQECYNTITIQCEDHPIAITTYKGEAKGAPGTWKVGQSSEYVTGWTGTGYLDFSACGSTEYMLYEALEIQNAGNYKFVVYACNGAKLQFKIYQKTAEAYAGLENAVQYNGATYKQISSTQIQSSSGSNYTVIKQYTVSQDAMAPGDYLLGLSGQNEAKFDRIDVTATNGADDAFCYNKKPLEVNSLPWSQGAQLDYGDTIFVTPTALQGCVNRVNLEVLGMVGDLYKVFYVREPGDTILLKNNVAPGNISLEMNDDIRAHGFMIVGVISVSLGHENNVINGDTKTYDGLFVNGNTMYDANGVPFVMRGTNIAHVWFKERTMTDLEAIASHGANTVRVVLGNGMAAGDNNEQWGPTPVSEVSAIIDKCEELGLVCVLEVHNTTGKDATNYLSAATDYWLRIKDALYGHEATVVINIGNEWMNGTGIDAWANAYKVEIPRLRAAGLHHLIMVDANGYGQGASSVASDQAVDVFNADPDKNTCFSLHMYQTSGGSDNNVRNNINDALGKGICLVIGEYGWAHKAVVNVSVKYQTIISYTNEKKVGALSWSWYGNSGGVEYLDMVDASNNFIEQSAGIVGSCNWGQYVKDYSWNWSGSQQNTIYTNERVLQVRSIRDEMNEQAYTAWDAKTSLNLTNSQLSLGPEHFTSAELNDRLRVHAGSVGASPKGAVYKNKTLDLLQGNIDVVDGSFAYTFSTQDALDYAKKYGLVIRGTNYTIESVELETANCHPMRDAVDSVRITTPLAIGHDYFNTFNFGNWDTCLVFKKEVFDAIEASNILRFRITPSAGYEWDDTRVTYRCYTNSTTINGVTTVGQIDFDHKIDSLCGAVPDRQGYVDLYVDAAMRDRLKSHGLVVFGKNAKMHYFSVIGDTFVVPADSATLVPECGIDNLIIHQGGQVINQGDVKVFKQISFVRNAQGSYTYCSFDDQTTKNFKGEGGTYTNEVNKWYTFTTPFPVNQIQAFDDEGYWDINPVWTNGGVNKPGFFYMESLVGEQTGQGFRTSWQKINTQYPQARVPYIILFATDADGFFGNYFAENPKITYTYNVPVGQTLTISGRSNVMKEVPANDVKTYYLLENNTLYDMSFEGSSAYVLNTETNMFELVENAVVHPFECYVQATDDFKYEHPTLAMSRLEMFISDYNTPTSLETLNAAILLDDPDTRVYDVMGREYNVDHLPHGVFILVNHGQAIKVML